MNGRDVKYTSYMKDNHFKYFLLLEKDFEATLRYVELDKRNEKVFSVEYLRLFLTVCAEVEVVCKQVCSAIQPDHDVSRTDFTELTQIITSNFPKISETEITVLRSKESIFPFKGWGKPRKHGKDEELRITLPSWWNDYNLTKHKRDKNFDKASLKNVLQSLAGLYVLLLYWYRQTSESSDVALPDYPNLLRYEKGGGPIYMIENSLYLPDFP